MNDRNQPNMTAPMSPTAPAPPPPADRHQKTRAQSRTIFSNSDKPDTSKRLQHFLLDDHRTSGRSCRVTPQNKTTKYEHIIPQLVAAEQNPKIEGILIIFNTVGGDVEAGLAIAEMIASSKPSVTVVLGGGHASACRSRSQPIIRLSQRRQR